MRRCRRGGVTGEYRQLVGRLARHCRFTLVLRAQCLVVADGGADRLATTDRVQPQPAHQPLNPATRYCLSFTFHLLPDLVGPVDLKLVCQTALIFGINTPSRRALALSNEASRHRATCRRYVDGGICRTLQIGSTPNRSCCASTSAHRFSRRSSSTWAGYLEDPVGAARFLISAPKFLYSLLLGSACPVTKTAINLLSLDPAQQCLWHAGNFRRYRLRRGPQRRMVASMLLRHQDSTYTNFRG